MTIAQGTVTNSTGLDPGGDTYITEIESVKTRVGLEAFTGAATFQEAVALRHEIQHTIKGYGEPELDAGLNGLTEVDDGPFCDSVEKVEDGEELDTFVIVGTEFDS